jgi:hypothetical protein
VAVNTILASAASERYGWWLLNMVGSVHANSPLFDRIVFFDLGLSRAQRRFVRAIRGAELREVPPFVPHWREGRTWKPWIWTRVEADCLVWLDAGLTVLRPLDEALAQIEERGYFVVSQGIPVGDSTPADYHERFGLPLECRECGSVAAGILGFRISRPFYERVVVPTLEAATAGFSIGFSPGEVAKLNYGLDRSDEPVRDCPHFRWDQTLFNIFFYREIADPVVNDVFEFGGWKTPQDHPVQVIWSHRRRGDFRALHRVRYKSPLQPLGFAFGLAHQARWWRSNHRWRFRPATYLQKAKRLVSGG